MNATTYAAVVGAAIIVATTAILSVTWLLLRLRDEAQMRRRLDPERVDRDRDLAVPGTAHFVQMEQPAAANNIISDFLDTLE